MICNNCGGEYLDTLSQCPFCGAENEMFAQKEQDAYIAGYRNREIDMGKIVDRKVKKANRLLWKICGIAGILLVLSVICSGFYTTWKAKQAFGEQQKKLEQMEVYYQADDIKALTDYLDSTNEYGTIFDKYREVIYSYRNLEYVQGYVEEIYRNADKYGRPSYSIDWKVESTFSALDYVQKIADAGYPYDNEEKISSYIEQLREILHESFGFSDEDITAGMEIYHSEERDFGNMAEKALDYIMENVSVSS